MTLTKAHDEAIPPEFGPTAASQSHLSPWRSASRRTDIFGAMSANVVIALVGAASGISAARLLSADGRGNLAAVTVTGSLCGALSMLGLPEALLYFIRRQTFDARQTLRTVTTVGLLVAAIGALACLPLVAAVLDGAPSHIRHLARWWLVVALLHAFTGLPVAFLRAVGRESLWNSLRVVPGVLWLGVLLAAFLIPPDDRLSFVIGGQLIALTLFGAATWVLVSQMHPISPRPSLSHASALLGYGLPLALAGIPQALNTRFDQLLLVRFVSGAELGQYVTAVAWSSLVSPLVSAFGIVLFPALSSAASRAEVRASSRTLLLPAFAVAGLSAGAAAAMAPFAIPVLFGPDYRGAIASAQVLALGSALMACSIVLAGGLQGLGATRAVLSTECTGLALNVVLVLFFGPRLGILGAAIASTSAYAVICCRRLRLFQKLIHTEGDR